MSRNWTLQLVPQTGTPSLNSLNPLLVEMFLQHRQVFHFMIPHLPRHIMHHLSIIINKLRRLLINLIQIFQIIVIVHIILILLTHRVIQVKDHLLNFRRTLRSLALGRRNSADDRFSLRVEETRVRLHGGQHQASLILRDFQPKRLNRLRKLAVIKPITQILKRAPQQRNPKQPLKVLIIHQSPINQLLNPLHHNPRLMLIRTKPFQL